MKFFNKHKKQKIFLFFVLFLGLFSFSLVFAQDVNVDSVLMKVSLKDGEEVMKNIVITNPQASSSEIKLKLNNELSGLIFLKEEIVLGPKEKKTVNIFFKNEMNYPAKTYIGNIQILTLDNIIIEEIPVIVELESKDVMFDSNIDVPSAFKTIYPGDKITADISVFNLEKIGLTTVSVDYLIQDFDENTIISESENLAVGSFFTSSKSFELPSNIKKGDYVLSVIVEYKNSIASSTYYFTIKELSVFEPSQRGSFPIDISAIIFITAIFLIILFTIYFNMQRDKLFLDLEKQHSREIVSRMRFLEKVKNKEIKKAKSSIDKKRCEKRFEKLRKKAEKFFETRNKNRKKELENLRRKGSRAEILKKLKEWKKEGYSVSQLESKLKKTNKIDIRDKIKQWKKKGYSVDLLEDDLKRLNERNI